MLAVLLAGARPGQRRPAVGEAAPTLWYLACGRARAAVTGFANPAWVDAAAVIGLLAALVLLSQRATRILEAVSMDGPIELETWPRAVGWGAIVLTTLVGLRRAAAVLAWMTALLDPSRVGATWAPMLSMIVVCGVIMKSYCTSPPETAILATRPGRLSLLSGWFARCLWRRTASTDGRARAERARPRSVEDQTVYDEKP